MKYYKYPRTLHLPWSDGIQSDDKILTDTSFFNDKLVVVTEKMDGENTTMYRDHLHARSLDSRHHPSRDWVKALHAQICHLIPEGWRLSGENIYAKHAIEYNNLDTYFYLFSIWDENNNCLSWKNTVEWAELLGLTTPIILYQGLWDEKKIRDLQIDVKQMEGYVVRLHESFEYVNFHRCCAKWVRSNHVQTNKHWMHQEIVPNKLKGKS